MNVYNPLHAVAGQVVAEREAWKLSKEHGLDLVAILPVFVVGPVLGNRLDSFSITGPRVRLSWSEAMRAMILLRVKLFWWHHYLLRKVWTH